MLKNKFFIFLIIILPVMMIESNGHKKKGKKITQQRRIQQQQQQQQQRQSKVMAHGQKRKHYISKRTACGGFRKFAPQMRQKSCKVCSDQTGETCKLIPGTFYTPLNTLYPGQTRVAKQVAQEKINQAMKNGNASFTNKQWKLRYNQGTSIIAPENALPVIKLPKEFERQYMLSEGAEDIVANIHFAGMNTTIPVTVVMDYSNQNFANKEELLEKAYKDGYIYPFTFEGKIQLTNKFSDLVNDENLSFALMTARVCKFKKDEKGQPITLGENIEIEQEGPEYPLWFKADATPIKAPFIIATKLRGANFKPFEENFQIQQNKINQARTILANQKNEAVLLVPQGDVANCETYYKTAIERAKTTQEPEVIKEKESYEPIVEEPEEENKEESAQEVMREEIKQSSIEEID